MKFSIRDMMLVTVSVALAMGWWVDRSQLASAAGRYKESLMKLRRRGVFVGDYVGPEMQTELNATMQAELNATWEAEHDATWEAEQARKRRP